jgi:hypothetical protein
MRPPRAPVYEKSVPLSPYDVYKVRPRGADRWSRRVTRVRPKAMAADLVFSTSVHKTLKVTLNDLSASVFWRPSIH